MRGSHNLRDQCLYIVIKNIFVTAVIVSDGSQRCATFFTLICILYMYTHAERREKPVLMNSFLFAVFGFLVD